MRLTFAITGEGRLEAENTVSSGAAPQVSVQQRIKGLRSHGQWSLDGLPLVLALATLVAVVAIVAVVVSQKNKKKRDEAARAAAARAPKRPASEKEAGKIRLELRTGDAPPAVAVDGRAIDQLKTGTSVILFGESIGDEVCDARIASREDLSISFAVESEVPKLPWRIFVARRRFDAEIIVYPFLVESPTDSTIHGTFRATLDAALPILRLQASGTLSCQLMSILILAPNDRFEEIDTTTMPSRQATVTAIGVRRAWLSGIQDIETTQHILLRLAIPGEPSSIDLAARRRGERTDHEHRPVVELNIEPRTHADLARLIRYVTMHSHATLPVKS